MNYTAATYGDRMADVYDSFYGSVNVPKRIDVLEELAAGGRALELGIGTGSFALPLAARGVEVHGIDVSEAMVEQLRAKAGGAEVPVTIGDFADVDVEGTYSLVYVLNSTLFMLTEQEEQVRCFENVAARLDASGVFLVDAFVPDVTRFDRGQEVRARLPDLETVRLDVSTHDPMQQLVDFRHVLLSEEGIRVFPARLRYAWPAELDLMARLAGLRLRERWGDWDRSAFTSKSEGHVSVYERA
ncbi:MAG: class I SAM-dependent methyltransferase [Chloroflexota bacterium]|nr:class I SAM-dependent methyltransferase [Rhodospirillaceae bacterium]MDE2767193.1 class I SAM-dependent methyltransferase [Chloroflexota bacterium]MDE2897325.1 class I SAM-dependent methyltransferase [Chloroflexota bacterium]